MRVIATAGTETGCYESRTLRSHAPDFADLASLALLAPWRFESGSNPDRYLPTSSLIRFTCPRPRPLTSQPNSK